LTTEQLNRPKTASVSQGALLHNLLLFSRILHGLGLEVNPGRMIEIQEAFGHVPIGRKADFYYTLRTFLVKRKQDLPLFDKAFELFWRKRFEGDTLLNLDELLGLQEEERPPDRLVVPPQVAEEEEEIAEPDAGEEVQEIIELTLTYSEREALRQKDFADLTPQEFAAIKRMMNDLVWELGHRQTRRYVSGRAGILDIRRSMRQNLRYGSEILKWAYRTPKIKTRPLIVLADISGSMQQYTRPLLHFLYGLKHGLHQRVEVFVFATRLSYITRQLRHKDIDEALHEVTETVHDWSGGTRIGDAVKQFNYHYAKRVLHGGPVVLLISDGWDRGDPHLLRHEMARLHRLCHRLIWLNPLLGSEQYQPLTRGMQAALPHIDDFLPVHNLASLEDLARHLRLFEENRLPGGSLRPSSDTGRKGAAFVGGKKGKRWKKS
jgi:uncharacterized protein with von Willebrand factor type A (vWA) domain